MDLVDFGLHSTYIQALRELYVWTIEAGYTVWSYNLHSNMLTITNDPQSGVFDP